MASLVSASRLNRISLCSQRFGEAGTFQVEELLNTVEGTLFKELDGQQKISFSRRQLQKAYVDALIQDLSPDKSANSVQLQAMLGDEYAETDIPSIVRGHLIELKNKLEQFKNNYPDVLTKYHLQDLDYRISKAVDSKV
jgi:hypothetical protein